ncbi:putative NACHT [Triplophysa rosa]|uniref:NACHT n=1 Tax=Triplophysa rosa TaxID=992332 RepID=A0A9W7WZ68_TRIRA|nr:putative NACHT [Triplophysa rosa]
MRHHEVREEKFVAYQSKMAGASSPEPSCVSVKSDESMRQPLEFSDGAVTSHPSRLNRPKASSPEPSAVSMKSHWSMVEPPQLSDGAVTSDPRLDGPHAAPPEPSCLSMKSHWSMVETPQLNGAVTSDPSRLKRPKASFQEPSSPSCVSMKSHWSMVEPPRLSNGAVTSHPRTEEVCYRQDKKDSDLPEETEDMQQDCHDESVEDVLQRVKDKHKSIMKNKYESLFEGMKAQENQTLLKRIYTQVYIREGESEGVNEEHEVLHMEKQPRRTQDLQDTPIYCNDIFTPQSHQRHKIKSVLTKGIAGIGKTVSVHKFILDWAEGTANQDVDFMFLLPFRELNLIREHRYSLHKLLLDFHPELQDVDSQIYEECKVVFIFDGLDESRMTRMFSDSEKVSDVTDASSVAVLMSNLMKGDLLPSALIWITSRPAAANLIPSKYITRVTEIQGFDDAQKEEYFRKRISDEHQASRIISHIRRARSLHIMCHIPVFCWISSTVLQKILTQDHSEEIPKTLSEMYIHFLLIQMKMKNEKYDPERDPEINREVIVKLAEVAFKQLMKGNVMFYEEDLRECGIDITDASLYSGICTEIFKEEPVSHQRKIYSFIHLSFQEFLAAFYVFYYYVIKITDTLQFFDVVHSLQKKAVDKALESETGHLDLFLRFLLGISLESNQRLLQDLLTHTVDTSQTIKKTTQYIKDQIKNNEGLPADRCINLFLCLLEVKDQTLYREIEEFVRSDKHSEKKLSAAHCSAIAYMLQMSEEVMDEFDMKKYNTTQEGRRRLIPAVNNCTRALLSSCNLTAECCESLSSALQSSDSPLRDLDMSNNDLQDSGVKLISDALKNTNCQLQILRLSTCNLIGECCESLSSALQSSNSPLRDLDVSNNDLQDSGVKLISDALNNTNCQLQILRLSSCNLTAECCESLSSALQSSECPLRDLDVSNNDLQDSGVKLISDALKSQNCHLQTLRLADCNLTVETCKIISSALQSSDSPLRDLDVSNNDLQDSGVKLISDALKNTNCHLQTLRLSGCMVTDEGCCYLASALSSNPSHLRELDLSYNHPQHSALQLLAYQSDPDHTLNKLNLDHGGCFRIAPGLRKYACDVTLDPNTANVHLVLSDGNGKVTYVDKDQSYPDHPERFKHYEQVLSKESFSGRCYWEAEWSGWSYIGMTSKEISRDGGNLNRFGYNDVSWCLFCVPERYSAWHNNKNRDIPAPLPRSQRLGVYVDWPAGTLSFYSVSDTHTLTHLHTFNTTFTQPLYAALRVYNSSVSLCQIK